MNLVRRKCWTCKKVKNCVQVCDDEFKCPACGEKERLAYKPRSARGVKAARVKKMTTKLEACPFCGNQSPKTLFPFEEQMDEIYVWCNDCRAKGPYRNTEEAAVREWNKRVEGK